MMDEIWCVPTAESRLRLVCGVVVSHGDGGCPLSSHPRPDSIRHTLLGAQSPVHDDPYRRGNRIQI